MLCAFNVLGWRLVENGGTGISAVFNCISIFLAMGRRVYYSRLAGKHVEITLHALCLRFPCHPSASLTALAGYTKGTRRPR